MLITFKTSAYANITMFGDVGLKMLEMMDFGTEVPGAIREEDVATARQNLVAALDRLPEQVEAAGEADDDQPAVSLHTRAVPLLELLQAASDEQAFVSWQ